MVQKGWSSSMNTCPVMTMPHAAHERQKLDPAEVIDTSDGARPRELLESCRWTLDARERRGGAVYSASPPSARTPAGDDVADEMTPSGSDERDVRPAEGSTVLLPASARGMTTGGAARGGGGGGV